jgi:MinD superfamily P-loop ATPase
MGQEERTRLLIMPECAALSGVEFRLNEAQCLGCAICADVCPEEALVLIQRDLLPAWCASRCSGCRLCEVECPTAAINITKP